MSKARKNRPSWDQVSMDKARVAAQRSPDPDYQVGCVIVTADNALVSDGYNGPPRGIDPDSVPWDSEDKHFYVCHAEANAILLAKRPLDGCKLYTTLFPCNECMRMIIQSGIREVYYADDSKLLAGKEKFTKSKEIADRAGIKLCKINA